MTADLAIAAFIGVVVLIGLGGLWFKQAQDQTTGAALQAGKVSQATADTQAKIIQADAAAPVTHADQLDRLRKGTA